VLASRVAGVVPAAAAVLVAGVLAAPGQAAAAPGIVISGVDLHDGMILQYGGTYYMYGTEYGCGFQWRAPGRTRTG
jgi:hypothetical protein